MTDTGDPLLALLVLLIYVWVLRILIKRHW